MVMCTHTFFDCDWVNDSTLVHTGNASADYTTSVMGNASVASPPHLMPPQRFRGFKMAHHPNRGLFFTLHLQV